MTFKLTELGSYVKVQGGYAYKSADFKSGGDLPVLKIKNVRFGYIDYEDAGLITAEVASKTEAFSTSEGDILISMTGSGPNAPQSLVGRVARVWSGEPKAWINQRVGRILLRDKNKIHPDFVFYLLSSKNTQDYLVSNSSGSANQANINGKTIESVPCPEISYEESERISKVLRSLDEKILLNRQINQTLEQIAQTIFKSWFVDFEPVKAKIAAREALIAESQAQSGKAPSPQEIAEVEKQAAIAAIAGAGDIIPTAQLQTLADLFPNQLVESELGEIPEGWEVKSFGDVSTCFDSKRVPLSKKKREEKKPGDIPYYGATSVMDYVNEWIFDDIYLLLGEDGSVVKDDGSPFVQYIWGKSWVNNHAHVLQGKAGVSTEQLMLFMKSQNIAAYVTGAVQLKLNQKNMNSIPFFDAGEELNTFFYQVIEPFYSAIRNNSDEIEILSHTRDILLPKLLSGEIELTANQKDLVNA